MNLDTAQAIAEIVSAIGVVATLAYLAIQIRQSATISRADIRQQLAGQQIQFLMTAGIDPTLRAAQSKVFMGEPLTPDEQTAYGLFAISGLRLFESCHAQWEYGTLPDEDWRSMERRYSALLALEPFAREFRPELFNPRFATRVAALLTEQEAASGEIRSPAPPAS
jgi:hypothetical protein